MVIYEQYLGANVKEQTRRNGARGVRFIPEQIMVKGD